MSTGGGYRPPPPRSLSYPIPQPVRSPLGQTPKGAAFDDRQTGSVSLPKWVAKVAAGHPPRPSSAPGVPKPSQAVFLNKPTPGLPPPPPQVYGNPAAIAAHAHRYLTMENVSWRPERFVTYLKGRPWVLVIETHENAPPWEWFNTVGEALKPLRAVFLMGVTAKSPEAPGLDPSHACANWFKATLPRRPPYTSSRVGG